jgi:hypothetical protein
MSINCLVDPVIRVKPVYMSNFPELSIVLKKTLYNFLAEILQHSEKNRRFLEY